MFVDAFHECAYTHSPARAHAYKHTRTHTHSHVYPGVVSPFSPSHIHLFHLLFFSPVTRSVSHAITQAAPWGEPSPVALLDAIIIPSAGSVFPDCALGLPLQGGDQWRGVGGRGREEGGAVVILGYSEREGEGGLCFWQQPTQSCPVEPRAGLMSSCWPIRRLLLAGTHAVLPFSALSHALLLLLLLKIPQLCRFLIF